MAARLTERPGSSAYVAGGVVAYSNEAKAELLGVDPALIERHGAVSLEVAEAMADGALARFEADTAVAITGVAGPGRRDRGQAGGLRLLGVKLADGAALARDARAARRPRRHPRPLHHRRHAPAAAGCCAGRTASPERPTRAHVRGARPARGRASELAAWRDALVEGRDGPAAGARRRRST